MSQFDSGSGIRGCASHAGALSSAKSLTGRVSRIWPGNHPGTTNSSSNSALDGWQVAGLTGT